MDEKEKWLKETGYEFVPMFERYQFVFKMNDYNAHLMFMVWEIRTLSLDDLKNIHADFIERAERKEKF